MTTATLETALSGLDAQKRCEIWAKLSQHSSILFGGASQEQIESIAMDLDKVSQGMGLSIISIVIWPNDSLPESLNSLVVGIRSALGLIDDKYFQELIGMPTADFIEQFTGADNPIDDAICWILYKVQNDGTPTPKGFVDQARRYLLGSKA